MKRILVGSLLIGLVMSLVIGGCAAPAPKPTPPEGWPEFITIGSSPGGAWAISVGLASLIEHELGIPATVSKGVGSAEYIRLLGKGAVQLAIPSVDVSRMGYAGTGVFEGAQIKGIRVIGKTHNPPINLITMANSGIRSFKDLRGKRFAFKSPAIPYLEATARRLLEFNQMTEKDVTPSITRTPLGVPISALTEGTVDAFIMTGSVGTAAYVDLAMSHDVFWIPLTEEEQKYLVEKEPYLTPFSLPAGTYKGQDKDLLVVAIQQGYITLSKLPDDLVYEISKVLMDTAKMDSPGRFKEFHAWTGTFTIRSMTEQTVLPFHAGAVKYYKERGAWTAELEQRQKNFLGQ